MLKILVLIKYEMLIVYMAISIYSGFKLAMEAMESGRKINKWTFTMFLISFPTSLITFAVTFLVLWGLKISLALYMANGKYKRID